MVTTVNSVIAEAHRRFPQPHEDPQFYDAKAWLRRKLRGKAVMMIQILRGSITVVFKGESGDSWTVTG